MKKNYKICEKCVHHSYVADPLRYCLNEIKLLVKLRKLNDLAIQHRCSLTSNSSIIPTNCPFKLEQELI